MGLLRAIGRWFPGLGGTPPTVPWSEPDEPGWYAGPSGEHEARWWGGGWTERVADDGREVTLE